MENFEECSGKTWKQTHFLHTHVNLGLVSTPNESKRYLNYDSFLKQNIKILGKYF